MCGVARHARGVAFSAVLLLLARASCFGQALSASDSLIQSSRPTSQLASSAIDVTRPMAIGDQTCAGFYPPIAIRLNQQGTTVVTVHVTAQGTVAGATIKAASGHDALDAATLRCAMTWTYRPATQKGIPVAGDAERTMCWTLRGACPPPIPFLPPPAPVGWEREGSPTYLGGILASYKLFGALANEQYLSAAAYSANAVQSFTNLADFVAQNDSNLRSVKELHVLSEKVAMPCGGELVSQIEYSQPGLLRSDPARFFDVEQVRTVKNSWAYVTTYIRPAESPKRPDAEQWIRAFCTSPG